MYRFLTLAGIICAIAGAGMFIILLLTLVNNQMPINFFGALMAITPFALIIVAAMLFSYHKI
jgi:hypothetical protein